MIGRGLQALALVMLMVGLLFGLEERGANAMALELGFLVGGVAVFWVGLQLQRRSGSG